MHFASQQQMIHIGSRSIISWFILVTIVLYILYSSNHVLFQNEHRDCSPHLDADSTKHLHLTNTSSASIRHQEKQGPEEVTKVKNLKVRSPPPLLSKRQDTQLKHIVFGIAASSKLWETRKEYIKIWWKPNVTRGVVWLDGKVNTKSTEGLPQMRISGDTSNFKYTNPRGDRSALRISRIVTETFNLGMKDVRWFVMGDDDSVFVVNNVVRILSKYDHRHFYYVGSSSESHFQNIHFSYSMAYGGGGFAISYPLAKELAKIQDRCIQRYPGLYGSDDRIQACMAEIGVPLTKELGFHQYDVHGNLLGLLGHIP
ncbi:hypothetical protein K1719_046518 [Acacia pycnantha]|nr:hypothetical protein K1719_046518 [Acacia pycnantha]